jgi:hypothetical protein
MNKRGGGQRRALHQRRGGCPARGSVFPQTIGSLHKSGAQSGHADGSRVRLSGTFA